MVKEIIRPDESMSKDAREKLNKCGVEFITMLTSQANEIAERDGKTCIGEEHFMEALKELGFESYLEKVKEAAQEHHEQEKEVWKIDGGVGYASMNSRLMRDTDAGQKEQEEVGARGVGQRGSPEGAGGVVRCLPYQG
jgi:histone H3/H4